MTETIQNRIAKLEAGKTDTDTNTDPTPMTETIQNRIAKLEAGKTDTDTTTDPHR